MVENELGCISMRVKDGNAIASCNVTEHHLLHEGAFPYSCFANDIDMLQPIFVFNAKGDVAASPVGDADGGDVRHQKIVPAFCYPHKAGEFALYANFSILCTLSFFVTLNQCIPKN